MERLSKVLLNENNIIALQEKTIGLSYNNNITVVSSGLTVNGVTTFNNPIISNSSINATSITTSSASTFNGTTSFNNNVDISFMEYFLSLIEKKDEFCVEHQKLIEYGIINDNRSNNIKRCIEDYDFKENIELLEKIIKNLIDEREKPDGLVHKNFGGFYTAHYNEILLYPHFEELLQICQKYRLCFMVLSNGVPLTPEKIDLIIKYKGVVNGICLNIPAFEPEVWSLRSGINIKQFDKLISNINYAMEQLPDMVKNKSFSIQVNGSNNNSFSDKGGWLDKGPEFPVDMDLDPITGELATQTNKARELFPGLQIFDVPSLIDRAGLLDHIMTNKEAIKRNLQRGDETKKVIGCGNGREVGGRPVGWIHVNAAGKVFLCCNDYDTTMFLMSSPDEAQSIYDKSDY